MLNSNKDKAIKRYLGKVGTLTKVATCFVSRYYTIQYEHSSITVRFSDHFKTLLNTDIDIVKTSNDLYVIKSLGLSYVLTEATVMPYLKSILLVYPEFKKTYDTFIKAMKKSQTSIQKLNSAKMALQHEMDKKEENYKLANIIWDENKELKEKLKKVNKQLKAVQSEHDKLCMALKKLIKNL